MRKVLLSGLAVAIAGAALAYAQDEELLKVDVDIVNLMFSVQDKKGALIPGLEKDAFTVFEDGKQQTVKYFTRETNLPLTIGLLVDVSRSQENLIEVEKSAAERFFSSVLKTKDMAFLISFGSDAELLQDSTNSVALLRKGLQGLRVIASPAGMHPGPVPTANKVRGTILYDAVYLAADEQLKREVGRKAIVVITDGMDYGSRYTRDEAIAAAHKSDAIIYSIQYVDPQYYMYGGGDGDLKRMSEETGGRMFRVGGKNTLESIFAQIEQEMRTQYAIGYTPTSTTKDGAFRKVEIKVSNKEYKVRARRGYFATPSN